MRIYYYLILFYHSWIAWHSIYPPWILPILETVFADSKHSFGGSYEITVEAELFDIGFKESYGFTCKRSSTAKLRFESDTSIQGACPPSPPPPQVPHPQLPSRA